MALKVTLTETELIEAVKDYIDSKYGMDVCGTTSFTVTPKTDYFGNKMGNTISVSVNVVKPETDRRAKRSVPAIIRNGKLI